MQEKEVLVAGKKLHYATAGKGAIIVLVHGWCNNWMGWIPLMHQLKQNFKIYAIDQLGFGKSSSLPQYSIAIQADFLAGFIRQLEQKPIAVCGLSLGTFVVADFGLRYSRFTDKLILIGAVLPVGRRQKFVSNLIKKGLEIVNHHQLTEAALKKIVERRLTAYVVSKYLNMYKFNRFLIDAYGLIGRKQMAKEAFVQMGIAAANYKLAQTINALLQPVLLIYGSNDKFTSLQQAQQLLESKRIRYIQIPQSGHITSLEQPQLVAAAIRNFVL